MDTNSNIQVDKQIPHVEILHLDEPGYGPMGKHTRREWRQECLVNLLAGKTLFEEWQKSWGNNISSDSSKSFAYEIIGYDGKVEVINDSVKYLPFCYPLDFVGVIFEAKLGLGGYIFLQPASFAGAIFKKEVNIANTIFQDYAVFIGARFYEIAYFGGTKFANWCYFKKSIFFEGANFSKSVFEDILFFDEAIFFKAAYFGNAIFDNDTTFKSVIFIGRAFFAQGEFKSASNFSRVYDLDTRRYVGETIFSTTANFESAIFHNIGNFEDVIFKTSFPSFRGCQIDKTRIEFSEKTNFPKEYYGDNEIKDVSFLKRLADEHGQNDQAFLLNKIELNAKRIQARLKIKNQSFFKKLLASDFWYANATTMYGVFSDYGQSFTRPLKYYFGLLVIIFLLALGNASINSPLDCKNENLRVLSDLWRDDTPCDINATKQDDKTRLNGYRAAAEYTVYRAAGILDFSDNGKATDAVARRLFGQNYEPGWMRFIGLIKAIASTALLFLAALGLRNKYRIK